MKETFLMDNSEVLFLIVATFHSAEVDRFSHDTHFLILFPHDNSYILSQRTNATDVILHGFPQVSGFPEKRLEIIGNN